MDSRSKRSLDSASASEDCEAAEGSTRGKAAKTARTGEGRKEQNRKAQRAFRDRKQAYIKELELKVEELSQVDHEERYERMKEMLDVLSQENAQLRSIVKELGACVGEGVGSALPRIGISSQEYTTLLDGSNSKSFAPTIREDEKTHVRTQSTGSSSAHVANHTGPPSPVYTNATTFNQSNPVDDYLPPIISRRPSISTSAEAGPGPSSYSHSLPSPAPYPPMANSNLRSTSRPATYQPSYSNSPALPPRLAPSPAPTTKTSYLPRPRRSDESTEEYFNANDVCDQIRGKEGEALQLIRYHLYNSRQNPHYHLPPCLIPLDIQRTTPHDPIIDGIPIPVLRAQLIRTQGTYSIESLFPVICASLRIHGQDVLTPSAWELDESLFKAFPMLASPEVLAHSDQWRISRGEQPLISNLAGPQTHAR